MQVEQEGARAGDVVLGGVALARVVDEVRSGEARVLTSGYNRTYNRHNR